MQQKHYLASNIHPETIRYCLSELNFVVADTEIPSRSLQIPLHRSHVTRTLLSVLAGEPGRRVSKREIHERLTRGTYVPHLHNKRIEKLLERLANRIKTAGFNPPWYCPGDMTITLALKIEKI